MKNYYPNISYFRIKLFIYITFMILIIGASGCSAKNPGGHIAFLWSPQGGAMNPSPLSLIVSDGNGDNLRFVGYFTGIPAFSPNGDHIAIGCPYPYTGGSTVSEICILDMDGFMSSRASIPVDDNYDKLFAVESRIPLPDQCLSYQYKPNQTLEGILSIDWSPKTNKLAIVCGDLKDQNVCILSMDGGSNCWKDIAGNNVFRAVWSPTDDNVIAIAGRDYPTSKIYLVDANGNNARYVTDGWDPEWSPNGQLIAYIQDMVDPDTKRTYQRIASINIDGSNHKFLFEPDKTNPDLYIVLSGSEAAMPSRLAWSPDGRYITFSGTTFDNIYRIFRLDLSTGKVEILFDTGIFSKFIGEPDWGP